MTAYTRLSLAAMVALLLVLTSTAVLASHTYEMSGSYSATLELWNCGGQGHAVYPFSVTVDCAAPRFAIFLPLVGR